MLTIILISITAMLVLNLVLGIAVVVLRVKVAHRSEARGELAARWHPRILQLLAGETSASTLISLVRRSDRDHLMELLTEYGRRLDGIELERLRTLGRPLLGRMKRALRSHHAETRARAVQAFGILGGEANIDVLVAALEDQSPLVAMVAAAELAEMADPEAATAIVAHLDRFELWSSAFLASMLASGRTAMVKQLRESLEIDDTPALTRSVAADALRLLRDPASADLAVSVLDGMPDREVAAACLRLLGALGTARHVDIVRGYASGDDFVLRAHAITALGSLRTGEEDVELLDAAIDDPSPWVALHAARALRIAGREDVLEGAAASDRPGANAAREILSGEPA